MTMKIFGSPAAVLTLALLAAAPVSATAADPTLPATDKVDWSLPKTDGKDAVAVQLRADEFVPSDETSRWVFKGHVELRYGQYVLTADQLVYDVKQNKLDAIGNVRIKEPDGALMTADTMALAAETREAFLRSYPDIGKKPGNTRW